MDIRHPVPTIYGYFQEKYGTIWAEQILKLKVTFGEAIENILMPVDNPVDMPTVFIKKEKAHEFLTELKNIFQYSFLTDYTATDELGDEDGDKDFKRFNLVFHLMNIENKARIRVKVRLQENESMPTVIPIWPGANWAEREIFDMFGIQFEGHPDLRRILMDMRWEGHPLRKDYPLRGYQIFLTPEPLDPELLK